MTKTKSTKHALLMSALALLLCVSMLIGSTYAWFTDSVTSTGNIIKSGTLEVTMEWEDGKLAVPAKDSADWKNAADTAIFDYDLWEPGYVEVRHLKIENEGTLALKYQLSIVANGEVTDLTDAIDVYYVDPATQIADRSALLDSYKLGTLTEVLANINTSASGNLLAGEAHTVTLALKMRENAGNEYQDKSIGSTFSVQLLATQLTYESDSFDDQYDADNAIFVSNSEELRNAIATVKDGGTVCVNDGIYNIDSQLTIAGKSLNIVGVGNNVVIHMTDTRANYNKILYIYGSETEGEDVTVNISNLTLTAAVPTKGDIWVRTDTQSGAKVKGNVNVNLKNITCTSIMCDNNYVDGDTANINVENSNIKKIALDASPFNGNGLNTYTNLTYKASRIDSINIQNGVNDLTHIKINGVHPTTHGEQQTVKFIGSAEELAALGGTKINGTYALMADIDMTGYEMKPIEVMNNDALVFNGNGYEISNITVVAAKANGMTGAGNEVAGLFDVTANASSDLTVNDLTIKNARVSCSGYAAVIVGYANSSTDSITLNNVDVIGATISSDSVAALVGYTVGPLTIKDCDVSDLALTGEAGRPEKVGAFIGTANTATCTVSITNCTNNTTYNNVGRVINGAAMILNGAHYVKTAGELASLLNGSESVVNVILADGKYENVLTASNKTINIVGENKDGAEIALTNAISTGNDHLGLGGCTVTLENVKVTFEDGASYAAYINQPTMTYKNCTIIGQQYIYGNISFIKCVFDNDDDAATTGFRYTYIYDGDVLVDDCDFNTQGHALIMYSDYGGAGDQTLTVRNSRFHGGAGRTAWAVANQNTAGIEIDGSCGANYTLILEGNNTFDGGFSGLWRIKGMKSDVTTTVNGVQYTGTDADVYVDGAHYTKDADRNVTLAN